MVDFEELSNFLVNILKEFFIFVIGSIFIDDVYLVEDLEWRLYGEDLLIFIIWFVVGLVMMFCVYLDNLDIIGFVFCFCIDFLFLFGMCLKVNDF